MSQELNPKSKSEQSKIKQICSICNKPAIGRYSPDMDIKGLTFCEDHAEQVGAAFYCLMTNNVKDFNDIMGTNLDPLD
jgi:hypothetical protein